MQYYYYAVDRHSSLLYCLLELTLVELSLLFYYNSNNNIYRNSEYKNHKEKKLPKRINLE